MICSQSTAYVCTDTIGEAIEPREDRAVFTGKMFPMVHVNAIVAGRGLYSAVCMTAMMCNEAGLDVDEIAERIPRIMFQASDLVEAAQRGKGMPIKKIDPMLGGSSFSIVFVGFSEREKRMVCHCFDRTFDAMSVQKNQVDRSIGPWVDSWGEAPHPQTLEGIEALARRQLQLHRRDRPASILGGKLIVAELTRDSMHIWQLCDLEAQGAN